MKKITMLVVAIIATIGMSLTADAASPWWIGGKVGYWHSSEDDFSTDAFTIAPEAGYDFNSKWSVGLALGFNYEKAKHHDGVSVFTLSPYARWKFFNSNRLTLFLDGGVDVACGDMDGFQIGIKPGLAYDITDHIGAVAHIGFLGYSNDYFNGGGDGFGFAWDNTSVDFGIYYRF